MDETKGGSDRAGPSPGVSRAMGPPRRGLPGCGGKPPPRWGAGEAAAGEPGIVCLARVRGNPLVAKNYAGGHKYCPFLLVRW
jgi:hypothetical protein